MKNTRALTTFLIAGLLGVLWLTPTLMKSQTTPNTQKGEKSKNQKAKKDDPAALAGEAKITMDQAREIALKKVSGTVESAELEREHGKLIYSFDIRTAKDITEVQVGALDGKIVALEHEDTAKEAKEKGKEAKDKSRSTKKK